MAWWRLCFITKPVDPDDRAGWLAGSCKEGHWALRVVSTLYTSRFVGGAGYFLLCIDLRVYFCLVPVTAGIWQEGDDGLNPDGSSPAAQQQQQQQPWSSANAMQLPTQLPGPMLQSEWNVDSSVQTVKRMKRRQHEPRIVDLPLLAAGKVAAEVSGVDPIAQVVPSSSLAISKPYFEATWPTNVSVVLGQPAVLKCRTRLLGDRMVFSLLWDFCCSVTIRMLLASTQRLRHVIVA